MTDTNGSFDERLSSSWYTRSAQDQRGVSMTAQQRQESAISEWIEQSMNTSDEPSCEDCGGTLHTRDMLVEWERDGASLLLCEVCVPRCALEADCGDVMVCGGEGGCSMHEQDVWLSELADESDPNIHDIITRLIELGYVAEVAK